MRSLVIILGVVILFNSIVLAGTPDWEDVSSGNVDFGAVLVDSANPKRVFAGVKGALLKSEDEANIWRRVLSVGGSNRINLITQSDKIYQGYYVLTTNGLYFSNNNGNNWRRIFSRWNYLENDCVSIAFFPDAIYLGSRGGLFISRDNARTWKKEEGIVGSCSISSLDVDLRKGYIYAVCAQGAFKSICPNGRWERIFITHSNETGDESTEDKPQESPEEESIKSIRYISVDYRIPGKVYLATSKGLYLSRDSGVEWEFLSDYGLLTKDINKIVISKRSEPYILSRSGVFVFRNERWQELSLRLTAGEIRSLFLGSGNNLYAACEKGLFRLKTDIQKNDSNNSTASYPQKEPSIKEVQQAAIKYAEVEPEKIARWRKQAAIKAILPQVSAGIDRNTSDLWHWESGSTTKADDDVLRKGDDSLGWDVRITWDLGELIWNEAQTSIDVRSKLMVQLRNDILDEVNKLYFERIRVKTELDNASIEERGKTPDKELRFQELTASLDGLTGGYFSQHLK